MSTKGLWHPLNHAMTTSLKLTKIAFFFSLAFLLLPIYTAQAAVSSSSMSDGITYTISGNAGVAGTVLSYYDGVNKTTTADGSGIYTFAVPSGWSGSVTPALTGYSFFPSSRSYTNVLADQTGQNFTAATSTFSISGNVGVAGATLTYTVTTGAPQSVTANSLGVYTLVVPAGWSGTVKPTSMGYHFNPAQKDYSGISENKTGENYTVDPSNKTYYVNETNLACNDAGSGTTQAVPFCKIVTAANKAIAGDTIRVLAGSYAETVKPNPGISGYPVTVKADPGVVVTGIPGNSTNGGAFRMTTKSYIVIDGFTIEDTADFGIYVYGANHITITNNYITRSGNTEHTYSRMAIYFDRTTDSLIDNNILYHNSDDGIRLMNSSNITISNNTSYANATHFDRDATGINLYYSTNNTIFHNITYANEDSGINLMAGSSANKVIGNVTYGNGDHGIDNNASPNNIIIGNTVQGNQTAGIDLEANLTGSGSGGATIMNNIMVDNGLQGMLDGGSPDEGSPGNLRIDDLSKAGTTFDYNLYYLSSGSGGTVQILYEPMRYSSLADFKSAVPSQEIHGLQGNPLLVAPAPPAVRPERTGCETDCNWSVQVNLGNNHISAGSPAIDSANADAPFEPTLDIEGFTRVDDLLVSNTGFGTRVYDDRGAYEFQPPCYALSINPGVNGATPTANPTKSPSCASSGQYIAGQVIQLTANPDTGYHISGWTGTDNNSSTATTNSVTMPTGVRTVGVTYTPNSYPLTVSKIGTGSGTVTSNPMGINCGSDCSQSYDYPTSVALTATAAPGSTFTGWTGDGTGTGIRTVIMNSAKSVTASFVYEEYTLTITSLHGIVTKNPDKTTYHYGDVVQLSAAVEPGWTFANWSGDVTGSTNPVSITMNGNKSVTANYTQNEYTLDITSSNGVVTKNPDKSIYHYGDVVQLSAAATPGWTFTGWSGDISTTDNPVSITIHGNISVTANYTQDEYTLEIISLHGTVTKDIDQATYHYGDIIQLTAIPEKDWRFTGWSGDATGSNNPISITIIGNMSVTANYTHYTIHLPMVFR